MCQIHGIMKVTHTMVFLGCPQVFKNHWLPGFHIFVRIEEGFPLLFSQRVSTQIKKSKLILFTAFKVVPEDGSHNCGSKIRKKKLILNTVSWFAPPHRCEKIKKFLYLLCAVLLSRFGLLSNWFDGRTRRCASQDLRHQCCVIPSAMPCNVR